MLTAVNHPHKQPLIGNKTQDGAVQTPPTIKPNFRYLIFNILINYKKLLLNFQSKVVKEQLESKMLIFLVFFAMAVNGQFGNRSIFGQFGLTDDEVRLFLRIIKNHVKT